MKINFLLCFQALTYRHLLICILLNIKSKTNFTADKEKTTTTEW